MLFEVQDMYRTALGNGTSGRCAVWVPWGSMAGLTRRRTREGGAELPIAEGTGLDLSDASEKSGPWKRRYLRQHLCLAAFLQWISSSKS